RGADLAVARPKDGTVLSVLREAASAAEEAADAAGHLDVVAEAALRAARGSLERTREILPELRRAGVVDAGAKGFVLLLDAMWAEAVGPGCEAVFRSLGAGVVPGADPAGDDLARAIEAAAAEGVVVIPNGEAAVRVSDRAAERAPVAVRVVSAASIPAGVAAA